MRAVGREAVARKFAVAVVVTVDDAVPARKRPGGRAEVDLRRQLCREREPFGRRRRGEDFACAAFSRRIGGDWGGTRGRFRRGALGWVFVVPERRGRTGLGGLAARASPPPGWRRGAGRRGCGRRLHGRPGSIGRRRAAWFSTMSARLRRRVRL